MIKDDFEYEGMPKPDIWVSIGSPECRGGKLLLPDITDLVRSKNPFKLDEGAKVTFVISSGNGSLFLSPYGLTNPPNVIEGIPYYQVQSDRFLIYCKDNKGLLGTFNGAWHPTTIEIESTGGKLNFYITTYDRWGRQTPRTLLASTTNQFSGKDTYVYFVGGAFAVDSVVAVSGSENPMALAMSSINQIIYILPIMILLIVLPKTLKGVIKETREEV